VLDGWPRKILVLPLAIAFFGGLSVVAGCVLEAIFGERTEEPTRARMLLAAVCAALFGLSMLALASSLDNMGYVHAVGFGLRFVASAGFWVCIGCLLGVIFGRLPESEMAEGD
jgi:hypothetical protein